MPNLTFKCVCKKIIEKPESWLKDSSTDSKLFCESCGRFIWDRDMPWSHDFTTDSRLMINFNKAIKAQQEHAFSSAFERYKLIAEELEERNTDSYRNDLKNLYWKMIQCYFGVVYYQRTNNDEFDENYPILFEIPNKFPTDFRDKLIQHCGGIESPDYKVYKPKIDKLEILFESYTQAQNAMPDVFICFKATEKDANGNIRDSKEKEVAEKIYEQLTKKEGPKLNVFMSTHITNYSDNWETIIPSALLKSKRLIIVTSSPENAGSAWVRSEWERFLYQKKKEHTSAANTDKKEYLVAYVDCDPYNFKLFEWWNHQGVKYNEEGVLTEGKEAFESFIDGISERQNRHEGSNSNSDDHRTFINQISTCFLNNDWDEAGKKLDSRINNNEIVKNPHQMCELHQYRLMAELQVSQPAMLGLLHRNYRDFDSYIKISNIKDKTIWTKLQKWGNQAVDNLKAAADIWTSKNNAVYGNCYLEDSDSYVSTEIALLAAWQKLLDETSGLENDEENISAEDIQDKITAYKEFKVVCPDDFWRAVQERVKKYFNKLKVSIDESKKPLEAAKKERELIWKVQKNRFPNLLIMIIASIVPLRVLLWNALRIVNFTAVFFNRGQYGTIVQRAYWFFSAEEIIFTKELFILRSACVVTLLFFVIALGIACKCWKCVIKSGSKDLSQRIRAYRKARQVPLVLKLVYPLFGLVLAIFEAKIFAMNIKEIAIIAGTKILAVVCFYVSNMSTVSYCLSKVYTKKDLELTEKESKYNDICTRLEKLKELSTSLENITNNSIR